VAAPRASSQTTGIDPPVAFPTIQVYVPPAVGNPHCVLFNNGASPVYLGGSSVTAATGLYFPPNAQITLPYMPYGIWAIDGYTLGTVTTTLTTALGASGTTLTIAGTASIVAGTLLQIGNANRPTTFETVVVSAVVNAGTITTTTPVLYDHATGATVTTIAAQQGSSLSVNVGTT
jgi:hypothetical protein